MADSVLLDFAAVFDGLKDGTKNLFGDQPVSWKHRTILDIVETSVLRIQKLQDHRAPAMCLPSFSVIPSSQTHRYFEIYPPGRLHKSRVWRCFDEAIPFPPSFRERGLRLYGARITFAHGG